MSFPQSVNTLVSGARRKGRRAKTRTGVDDAARDAAPASVGVEGVVVDFGKPGATKLIQHGGKWGWDWALGHDVDARVRASEEAIQLFPGQKDEMSGLGEIEAEEHHQAADAYVRHRLEAYDYLGLKALIEEEYMDILIEPPLPRSKSLSALPSTARTGDRSVTAQTSSAEDGSDVPMAGSGSLDVYEGKKVVVIRGKGKRMVKAYAIFPAGPDGESLNISPFLGSGQMKASTSEEISQFVPASQPAITFPTPILQIVRSPAVYKGTGLDGASSLVVRLQASTHLLHFIPKRTYIFGQEEPSASIVTASILRPSDTNGLQHVDVALDPHTPGRVLLIDEQGGVWLWTETRLKVSLKHESHMDLVQMRRPITTTRDSFFRVAWSIIPGHALIISRRDMILLDLETGKERTILELRGRDRVFTDLDKSAAERGLCFTAAATTFEVLWVDEYAKKGVMSCTHELGDGTFRDLEIYSTGTEDEGSYALSSRSQRMVTILHGPTEPPARSKHHPYLLALPANLSTPLSSICSIPSDGTDSAFLLGLAPNGALESIGIAAGQTVPPDMQVTWTKGVSAIADAKSDISGLLGQEGKTETGSMAEDASITQNKPMKLRWAWLDINEDLSEEAGIDWADCLTYVTGSEEPLKGLLTAAEIARDVKHGDISEIRSRALRPVIVHNAPGTGEDQDIPATGEEEGLSGLVPVAEYDPGNINDSIRRLCSIGDRADSNARRHQADAERLATDLALSRKIYSSGPLPAPPGPAVGLSDTQRTYIDTPEDLFARVSLNDKEPPPIKYHYFNAASSQPSASRPLDRLGKAMATDSSTLSARHLLAEWQVGMDPGDYTWKGWLDPPEKANHPHLPSHHSLPSLQQLSQPTLSSQPQRPIRPLPGSGAPRSPLRSTLPKGLKGPPAVLTNSQSHTQAPSNGKALRHTESLPMFKLPPTMAVARSSPPPETRFMGLSGSDGMMGSSQDGGGRGVMAQTQVEPGKFGGRAAGGGGGKKKVKKRVGGF